MLISASRLIVCCLLAALLASSCTPSSPTEVSTEVYPTYDPFAPVGGPGTQAAPISAGQVSPPTRPAGPTPTRAPLSVTLPPRDPNSALTTPTPDLPHALPPPRNYIDQYTVQAGDTLGTIASGYGITLEALMQANGLNETSILSIGMVLKIPPIDADPNPGSAFKIIPDSELVYGPASVQFDLYSFIQGHGGYLASYAQDVDDEYLSGEQIITRIAQSYSVNPRLLLALLEYRSGWVTNPTPQNVDYPLGFYDDYYAGLYRQMAWAANNVNRGYYYWRVDAIATLPLSDGTYVPLDATINAGTAGVQYFLSLFNNRPFWDTDVSASGFFQTYNQLFGYPFDYDVAPLLPPNLTQPAMQLPFEPGTTWSYTGGPHGGWDTGSGWAALDFAPPGEALGCVSSEAWIVAVADGLIVRAQDGAVIQDLDNDGYEQTGWNIFYMHVETRDRIQPGTYVYAGERIGHPSCEGGFSNGTHVHLARKYNGEWISADGNLPFNLDGWVSSGNGIEYDGYLTRGSTLLEALEGRFEGLNQISR
ncbi:MAG: LysM peptidoglycan-binding domain-containing protein [Anaerolineales bacterium]|nr:LysM peptidoglycan-binding domain-containing protein [Anaerolineales bacterium]